MYHVVAVDDCSIIQQLLEMVFETEEDMATHVFAKGHEAMSFALDNSVDMFIIDWKMPGYDGKKLLEDLRAIPRYEHTPIIILSGDEEVELKLQAKHLGATGWMVKPFTRDGLINLIRKLLT